MTWSAPASGPPGDGARRRQEQGPAAGGGHQLEVGRRQDGGPALPLAPGHVGHVGRDADEREHRPSVPTCVDARTGRSPCGSTWRMPGPGRELIDAAIADGSVDTVVLAFPDMHGRPVGKRVTTDFFTSHVAEHGMEACDYLLAVDVDMNPLPGYRFTNWDTGYGDFVCRPDYDTARLIPWQPGTALRHLRPDRRARGAGRGVAPPDPAAPAGAGGRARPADLQRHRARVLPLQGVLRGGGRQGVAEPHAAHLHH